MAKTGSADEAWPSATNNYYTAKGEIPTKKKPVDCARNELSAISATRCTCIETYHLGGLDAKFEARSAHRIDDAVANRCHLV